METLEARVLLNADVDSGGPSLPDYIHVMPPPEAFIKAESSGEAALGLPAPGTSAAPPNMGPIIVPYAAVDDPAEFNGPVFPGLTGRAEGERNLASRASIFLQDGQGNIRSSYDESLNLAFAGKSDGSQPAETMVGPTAPAENLAGPPTPTDLKDLPKVPWTRSYSHAGTIEAGEDSVAFRVPVGPLTQTLTVDVQARLDGQVYTPRIDQVYLMGARGEVLASVTSVRFMTNGSEQFLLVSIHDAPIGSELIMRLVRGEAPQPPQDDGGFDGDDSSGDVQVPPPDESSGYLISILRDDVDSNFQVPSAPSPGGPTYITTLPTSTGGSATSLSTPGFSPSADASVSDNIAQSRVGEGGPDADGVDLTYLDEPAPAVYFGPLVSRTAAPLGPVLATFTGDPAPPTTRVARPSPDVLDALGADLDLDLLLNLKGRRREFRAADQEGNGPTAAELRGGGGAPILVAGDRPIDARTEAAALAASLQRAGEHDELFADVVDAPPRDQEAEGQVEGEVELARAGLATRAAGFLIGLGLASGPLYPDLAAFARRKLLRKSRAVRRKTVRRRA